jgi:hypothetical protein
MATVSKSLRRFLGAFCLAANHHSSVLWKLCPGIGKAALAQERRRCHTCCEKWQCTKRCVQSSFAEEQSWHVGLWGQPRRRRLFYN